ncbi:MAG: GNAT family N-acetyltransferase [Gemmatimonadota bacterium]
MHDEAVVIQPLRSAADAEQAYCCMADVPTPWPQSLCLCREWVARNLGTHLEGYHVRLAGGEVVGHLYYALSERALFSYEVETGVGVLYCEWIQRRHQGKGLGTRLFSTFLDEMRRANAKGIVVECADGESQMSSRHYLRRGFGEICQTGHRRLLYLPLARPRVEVRPRQLQIRPRRGVPVEILILNGCMCPYDVSSQVLVREVAREFGDQVIVLEPPVTGETLREYGTVQGLFINGRAKLTGAESEEQVRQAIQEEL